MHGLSWYREWAAGVRPAGGGEGPGGGAGAVVGWLGQ